MRAPALAGGPSGPRLFAQGAAIGSKRIGPEGPPTASPQDPSDHSERKYQVWLPRNSP
ncbi:DUF6053 domain-containing protein [Lysobacter enzymogenes]|uniref:DUF6053 domain-containing protein n=1 Tax=Lysobacter enzymogenes TaxID=69 RepID=UPI003D18EE15